MRHFTMIGSLILGLGFLAIQAFEVAEGSLWRRLAQFVVTTALWLVAAWLGYRRAVWVRRQNASVRSDVLARARSRNGLAALGGSIGIAVGTIGARFLLQIPFAWLIPCLVLGALFGLTLVDTGRPPLGGGQPLGTDIDGSSTMRRPTSGS